MIKICTYILFTVSVIYGRSAFSQETKSIPDLVDFMFVKNEEELFAYEHSIGSKEILAPFTQQLYELELDTSDVEDYQAEEWKGDYFFLRPSFGNLFHVVYYRYSKYGSDCEHYWFLSYEQLACVYSLATSFANDLDFCWQTTPDSSYLKRNFQNPPMANVEELFNAYESIRDGYSEYLGSEPIKCQTLNAEVLKIVYDQYMETGKIEGWGRNSPFLFDKAKIFGDCKWGKAPERSRLTMKYLCRDEQLSTTILIRLRKGY